MDFLWSINVWSPDSLSDSFERRLESLSLTDQMLVRVDATVRPHYRIERTRLPSGALFLQYRLLFGAELRGRARQDRHAAREAGGPSIDVSRPRARPRPAPPPPTAGIEDPRFPKP